MVYRDNRVWKKAKIITKCAEPRSYVIAKENGRKLRRNTFQMKRSLTKSNIKDNVDFEDCLSLPDVNEPTADTPVCVTDNQNVPCNNIVNNKDCIRDLDNRVIENIPRAENHYITRSGRLVKPIERLNL